MNEHIEVTPIKFKMPVQIINNDFCCRNHCHTIRSGCSKAIWRKMNVKCEYKWIKEFYIQMFHSHNPKWMCIVYLYIGRIIFVLNFFLWFIYGERKAKFFNENKTLCSFFFMNKNSLESCIHVTELNFFNRIAYCLLGLSRQKKRFSKYFPIILIAT